MSKNKNNQWFLNEHFSEFHASQILKSTKKATLKAVEHSFCEDKFIGMIFNKYFFNQLILLSEEQRDLIQQKLDKILATLKVMKERDEKANEVLNFFYDFIDNENVSPYKNRMINYIIEPFEVIETEDYYLKDIPDLKLCLLRAPGHWSITYKINNKVVQSYENINLVVAITENLQTLVYHAGSNKFDIYRLKLNLDKNLATKPKPEKMRIAKI